MESYKMSEHLIKENSKGTLEIFMDMKSDSTIIVEHFPGYSLYSIQNDDDVIEEHFSSKRDFENMIVENKWMKYDL